MDLTLSSLSIYLASVPNRMTNPCLWLSYTCNRSLFSSLPFSLSSLHSTCPSGNLVILSSRMGSSSFNRFFPWAEITLTPTPTIVSLHSSFLSSNPFGTTYNQSIESIPYSFPFTHNIDECHSFNERSNISHKISSLCNGNSLFPSIHCLLLHSSHLIQFHFCQLTQFRVHLKREVTPLSSYLYLTSANFRMAGCNSSGSSFRYW